MSNVSEILGDKGGRVLKIEASASVFEAVQEMVEANVGSLLVTDGGDIVGIVTERDYLRRVTLEGRTDKDTPSARSQPRRSSSSRRGEIDESWRSDRRRIRHLPVVEDGTSSGVSIGDLVKFRSKQQSFEIQYLTDYITAG
jgi:CBS domain-containing protein